MTFRKIQKKKKKRETERRVGKARLWKIKDSHSGDMIRLREIKKLKRKEESKYEDSKSQSGDDAQPNLRSPSRSSLEGWRLGSGFGSTPLRVKTTRVTNGSTQQQAVKVLVPGLDWVRLNTPCSLSDAFVRQVTLTQLRLTPCRAVSWGDSSRIVQNCPRWRLFDRWKNRLALLHLS